MDFAACKNPSCFLGRVDFSNARQTDQVDDCVVITNQTGDYVPILQHELSVLFGMLFC